MVVELGESEWLRMHALVLHIREKCEQRDSFLQARRTKGGMCFPFGCRGGKANRGFVLFILFLSSLDIHAKKLFQT